MSAPANKRAIFEGTVQPWGNSLGIRITRPVCELAHLAKGDRVDIEVTANGDLLIHPKYRSSLRFPTEAELLAGLTPHTAHVDELPTLSPKELGLED